MKQVEVLLIPCVLLLVWLHLARWQPFACGRDAASLQKEICQDLQMPKVPKFSQARQEWQGFAPLFQQGVPTKSKWDTTS